MKPIRKSISSEEQQYYQSLVKQRDLSAILKDREILELLYLMFICENAKNPFDNMWYDISRTNEILECSLCRRYHVYWSNLIRKLHRDLTKAKSNQKPFTWFVKRDDKGWWTISDYISDTPIFDLVSKKRQKAPTDIRFSFSIGETLSKFLKTLDIELTIEEISSDKWSYYFKLSNK